MTLLFLIEKFYINLKMFSSKTYKKVLQVSMKVANRRWMGKVSNGLGL